LKTNHLATLISDNERANIRGDVGKRRKNIRSNLTRNRTQGDSAVLMDGADSATAASSVSDSTCLILGCLLRQQQPRWRIHCCLFFLVVFLSFLSSCFSCSSSASSFYIFVLSCACLFFLSFFFLMITYFSILVYSTFLYLSTLFCLLCILYFFLSLFNGVSSLNT
jgi:hypothetical protein